MEFSRTLPNAGHPLSTWRHVHNEFFQVAIEYGVIGLTCLLWMVKDCVRDALKLPKTPLVIALTGILLAALMNSQVNFIVHLWAVGSYVLVAYCGLRVIEAESCPS